MTTEITAAHTAIAVAAPARSVAKPSISREEIIAGALSTYGTLTPMDIQVTAPKRATVTSITKSIHEMIEKSIAVLLSKQHLSKLRKNDCRPCKIISKKDRNILVTLGYGNRNAPFTALVPVKNFQSIGETVDYLKKLDEFLTKGFFEIEIKKLLEGYQAAAKVARDTKEAKFIERKLQKMVKDAVQTSGSNVYPFAKSQE